MGKRLVELMREKMEQERGELPYIDMAVGDIRIHLRITIGPGEDDITIETDDTPDKLKELENRLSRQLNMITSLALKMNKVQDEIFAMKKAAQEESKPKRRTTGWLRIGKR